MSVRSWRFLFVIGGAAAFAALALMVFDIVLTMMPGWGTDSVPVTVTGWFSQFASTPWLGLRNLDVLNVVASFIALPLYVAIYGALRDREPALALTGLVLVTLGTALFASANAGLPMLELSRRYAEAGAADRFALAAAAEGLLARGAHGSLGAYPGFLLSELGTLVAGFALLRSGVFGKLTAWLGIVGVSVLLAYTTAYTFIASTNTLVMAAAIPGGLLMIAWHVLVGRRLFALASER